MIDGWNLDCRGVSSVALNPVDRRDRVEEVHHLSTFAIKAKSRLIVSQTRLKSLITAARAHASMFGFDSMAASVFHLPFFEMATDGNSN